MGVEDHERCEAVTEEALESFETQELSDEIMIRGIESLPDADRETLINMANGLGFGTPMHLVPLYEAVDCIPEEERTRSQKVFHRGYTLFFRG